MNKYKYLAKNIGLLSLSSFGTKLLSFLLVGLYTDILSTKEYGVYDILSTTISLLIPILTINIHEGVMRYSLGNTYKNRITIFTSGFRLVLLSTILVGVLTIGNAILPVVSLFSQYPLYFVLLFFSTAIYQLFSNFARGIDKIKEVSIAGVISTAIGLTLNIVLLLFFDMRLDGYFIASIAAGIVPSLYLFFRLHIAKYIGVSNLDSSLQKSLYGYSAPLILNSVGWWINSASDRYVVTWLCGIDVNGIYSVGYKIPSILNVFQSIINQAWVLSSVKEYDPKDADGFFSQAYRLYNALLVIVCSLIIGSNKFLAFMLYKKEFYTAWIYVPYLTIAIIFGALSGLIGGVFSAVKDSRIYSFSTLIGAALNIILNIILVSITGAIGAAISTCASYFLIWCIRLICVRKYIALKINIVRDLSSYVLLVILSAIVHYMPDDLFKYSLVLLVVIVIVCMYKNECGIVLGKLSKFTKHKKI